MIIFFNILQKILDKKFFLIVVNCSGIRLIDSQLLSMIFLRVLLFGKGQMMKTKLGIKRLK